MMYNIAMKGILKLSANLALVVGVVLIVSGLWGIAFTYKNVIRENITTSEDASIPNTQVRGPLTLWSQAQVIRKHVLSSTGGMSYAEMPRTVVKVNEDGIPLLDNDGAEILIPNEQRDMWITATTLTTALNLAIITYVFSGLVLLLGFIFLWAGIIFWKLSKHRISIG